ncbi:hypothetical protein ACOMHN_008639 [Nucella lapillus]
MLDHCGQPKESAEPMGAHLKPSTTVQYTPKTQLDPPWNDSHINPATASTQEEKLPPLLAQKPAGVVFLGPNRGRLYPAIEV